MPGEPILIVDDTPVNLKLTRILLLNEGYQVLTAATAEEALDLLREHHPRMILADVQLPGINGLEFARAVKADPKTEDIVILAVTAYAREGDEQKAIEAGCAGYIAKPVDTRTLGECIRKYLGETAAPEPPAGVRHGFGSLPPAELHAIRHRFLTEGAEQSNQLLLDLDEHFDADRAARTVHQWAGTGGLLGYEGVSRLAREVEGILLERPVDSANYREALTNLVAAFAGPAEARETPVPESILQSLEGKSIGVIAFPPNERKRLCTALERAKAVAVFFDSDTLPDSEAVRACDLIAVHVRPQTANSAWLDPARAGAVKCPFVFAGARDHLLALDAAAQALAREFLMDSWLPEEALVRLSIAITNRRPAVSAAAMRESNSPTGAARPQVMIADDDATVVALVRTALANFGMECRAAADGRSALESIRTALPRVAVLDVNMPGMDGYEVLVAIRSEGLPVKVVLLTARQQESDVIRGFTLGADDYIVKPFSPMELVARLKRLLGR